MFKALLLEKTDAGFQAGIRDVDEASLPEGDVLLQVEHSTLNYKDGLAITNRGPVVRSWPMVAGIDGAGTVLQSSHPQWQAGDKVIHNGWGVGETRWGCLAQRASLKGDWLVALLARLGHRVVAATGKSAEADYLKRLGAAAVIDRAELSAPGKPLQKERWAAVVDAVGSHTLVNACAQTRYGGVVAACGLAGGGDLPGTVMPFILRGVTLAGIDSVMAPPALRRQAWERLARDLDPAMIDAIAVDVPLGQAIPRAHELMEGKLRGRVVVTIG